MTFYFIQQLRKNVKRREPQNIFLAREPLKTRTCGSYNFQRLFYPVSSGRSESASL
jgi:hypothetical protein